MFLLKKGENSGKSLNFMFSPSFSYSLHSSDQAVGELLGYPYNNIVKCIVLIDLRYHNLYIYIKKKKNFFPVPIWLDSFI